MKYECVVCGKDNLDKDTIGINKNVRLKAANSLCKE